MHNQYLLTELIKAQMRAEQERKNQEQVRPFREKEADTDDLVVSEAGSLRGQKTTFSTKVPKSLRGMIAVGLFGAAVVGFPAFLNYVSNYNQVYSLPNGVTQYRKMDGVYAHTILTKGDPDYGKEYCKVVRNTLEESREYIDVDGNKLVDIYILKRGPFGDLPTLTYNRKKDFRNKEDLFKRADIVLRSQYHRFKPLMENYLPNRLSR